MNECEEVSRQRIEGMMKMVGDFEERVRLKEETESGTEGLNLCGSSGNIWPTFSTLGRGDIDFVLIHLMRSCLHV